MPSRLERIYNLKRDDVKDTDPALHFTMAPYTAVAVKKVDLTSKMPSIYDQGRLGSCTANAINAAYQYNQIKINPKKHFIPSRLFTYYNARKIDGNVLQDAGSRISTGVNCVSTIGVIPETDWPYDISKFAVQPPPKCYKDAVNHKCTSHYRVVQNLPQLTQALINGLPIIIGIQVYSSFESVTVAKTGIVPIPSPNDTLLGGHAVLIVGFDSNKKIFIVRNSWGTKWGNKGYFTLPYAYVLNRRLTADCWCLATIKDNFMAATQTTYSYVTSYFINNPVEDSDEIDSNIDEIDSNIDENNINSDEIIPTPIVNKLDQETLQHLETELLKLVDDPIVKAKIESAVQEAIKTVIDSAIAKLKDDKS